jgi:hypothetical protein
MAPIAAISPSAVANRNGCLPRKIRRREIDGDAAGGQRQARGDQRRTHPLARLGDRLVGQANDMERRQARRDLHLHFDRAGLDPLKGYGGVS